jgi:Ca2+-binding EF-hand superfamily protein
VENSHDTTTICKAIFTKVDIDRDGKITFSEFILYAIDRNKLLEENVLENSFKLL